MRTLLKVRLMDVAPVNSPAYEDTSVGLRSLASKFDANARGGPQAGRGERARKFFKRTDGASPGWSGNRSAQAALSKALSAGPRPAPLICNRNRFGQGDPAPKRIGSTTQFRQGDPTGSESIPSFP
jgi:hypothetical protein